MPALFLWTTNDVIQKLVSFLATVAASPRRLQGVYIIHILMVKAEAAFKLIDLQVTLWHSKKFFFWENFISYQRFTISLIFK